MADDVESRALLAAARSAHRPGSRVPHAVVVLPSYSLTDATLEHFAGRLPALEHRQLLTLLTLARVPGCRMLFLTCQHPTRQVLDYYLSLVPRRARASMRGRIEIVEVPDPSRRPVAAKLLDRPDILARIRERTRGTLAFIEPWNVTWLEMEVARQLRLPLNGTPAELWPLGFKSAGRTVMKAAGVPVLPGWEDVRTVDDVVAAAEAVRGQHPQALGVVVKTDNAASGIGNRALRFAELTDALELRAAVQSLGASYLDELAKGGVVEELVAGAVAWPSVQVDIAPSGRVEVLSTHEQDVGGSTGHLYLGCRFPANPAYSAVLARHGRAVAEALAAAGALGRLGIDFAAVPTSATSWDLYGLEVNLRTSGTSHPLSALRSLVPGRYDVASGCWITEEGSSRSYRSTDNLHDPAWRGRSAREVVRSIRSAGLQFDRGTRAGVVLHMLSGLGIDGRLGLTCIARSPDQAAVLYESATRTLSRSQRTRAVTA